MSPRHRRPALLAPAAAAVLILSACASATPGSSPAGSALGAVAPSPPDREVIAQGTVMDVGGEIELCLGAVAESYPPQCSGIPMHDWTWDGIEGSETSGEVTWGAYAVQGEYDGESFTATQPPVMLALYDPMMAEDPTGGEPGAGDEDQLLEIQEALPDLLGDAYLSSSPQDGRVWVDVVWDDGTWQTAADADYGPDVVLFRPALRPVGG